MATLRRMASAVLPAVLAVAGLAACSSDQPAERTAPQEEQGAVQQEGGAIQPQSDGGTTPVEGGDNPCPDCQTGNDKVQLSDADGFEFETGEAEAGRIQAGQPKEGDEKPVTFDAGEGLTGTTGSSNINP